MSLCLECIALNEEEKLCFRDSERTKEYGWIGYLRGDFGRSGEEFHSTWFEGDNPELNNEQFKGLFDSVINILRQDGDLFSDMDAMWDRCYDSSECEISTGIGRRWEFRLLTNDYALYILCNPEWGDYNFYVHCYDKEMLMNKLAENRGLPRYCYGYLPTEKEEIRIDFATSGYTPYRKMASGRSAKEMNREIGVTSAQAEAMKAGSMFGWNCPAADPKSYNEQGKMIPPKKRGGEAR